jgi:hypothetical protein
VLIWNEDSNHEVSSVFYPQAQQLWLGIDLGLDLEGNLHFMKPWDELEKKR